MQIFHDKIEQAINILTLNFSPDKFSWFHHIETTDGQEILFLEIKPHGKRRNPNVSWHSYDMKLADVTGAKDDDVFDLVNHICLKLEADHKWHDHEEDTRFRLGIPSREAYTFGVDG